MKICAGCLGELPRESFSKRQWQMQQYHRRCKECIAADRELQLDPPPEEPNQDVPCEQSPSAAVVDGEGASCWLCLEEGLDESGHPLRRDCSCRGSDAGFAHLTCLEAYAKHKTENWDGEDIVKFRAPWVQCPHCHQPYQNSLAVELTAKFVAHLEERYPSDRTKLLEALYCKMCAIRESGEAKETGYEILSAIDQMKSTNHVLCTRTISVELATLNSLGNAYLIEGTKEGAKKALEHFERFRGLCIENPNCSAELLDMAKDNLARAKRECGDDSCESIEEILKRSQTVYDSFVAFEPEGSTAAIEAGLNWADDLRCANRGVDAERLLAKLLATCKRVHGPDHSLTKEVEGDIAELSLG